MARPKVTIFLTLSNPPKTITKTIVIEYPLSDTMPANPPPPDQPTSDSIFFEVSFPELGAEAHQMTDTERVASANIETIMPPDIGGYYNTTVEEINPDLRIMRFLLCRVDGGNIERYPEKFIITWNIYDAG